MTISRFVLMSTLVAISLVSCKTADQGLAVPEAPFEECVYKGNKTEFSVWAPVAQAAQLKLYRTSSDQEAFKTVDMEFGKDGLWQTVVREDLKGSFYTFQIQHNGVHLDQFICHCTGLVAEAFRLGQHNL